MKDNTTPKRLGSRLDTLYQKKGWTYQWSFFQLTKKWEQIAGREIAAHSRPAFLRNKEIWFYVDNSSMIQHMQLQKVFLLARIREYLPGLEISDLRWLSRPATAPESTKTKRPSHCPGDPREQRQQMDRFQKLTSTISNLQCRESLNNLYRCFQEKKLGK